MPAKAQAQQSNQRLSQTQEERLVTWILRQEKLGFVLRIGLLGHLQNVGHSVGQCSACALAAAEFLAERSAAAFLLLYSFEVIHSELQFSAEL